MKKSIILAIMLFIVMGLLAGCGDSEPSTSSGSTTADHSGSKDTGTSAKSSSKGGYTGFMAWKEGMWAETVMDSNGQEMRTKMELIEIDGDTLIFQYTFTDPGENVERTSQIWIDKNSKKPLKYVMDMDGQITCLKSGEIPEDAVPADDAQYPTDFPNMRYDTYTTPTGKTVSAAVYDMRGSEVWVSSEVPFGMVKVESQGKTLSRLYDFGTSGAKAKITKSQAENCLSMEDLGNQMIEQMQQQAAAGADVQEQTDSPLGGEAYASDYDGGDDTSGDVKIGCDACDQMPPAARNVCLQSCK